MSSTSSETADVVAVKRGKLSPLVYVMCIPLMVVLKMGFFFLVIGMVPTLLALTLVRHLRGYVASIVGAFNFAGVFPDLLSICMQGGTPRAVTDDLSSLGVWEAMYGAALLGWGIVWLSPSIAMVFLEVIYRGRMRHMEHLQKKMEEEWGADIRERTER